jgi:uncharacterized protein DUF4136
LGTISRPKGLEEFIQRWRHSAVKQIVLSSILLSLATSSAVAQDVRYNFADIHFDKFKTYKWVEIKGPEKVDELKDKEIKNALDARLTTKHLMKTEADTANLYIGYQAGVLAEQQFAAYNIDWKYGPGWYKEGWYGVSGDYVTKGETSTIHAGELAVECMTRENTIWCGAASSVRPLTLRPHPASRNRSSTNRWPSS